MIIDAAGLAAMAYRGQPSEFGTGVMLARQMTLPTQLPTCQKKGCSQVLDAARRWMERQRAALAGDGYLQFVVELWLTNGWH